MREAIEGAAGVGQREAILAAAARLFAERGFAKTNTGDIAGQCGMSPANLYRYYRNKHAIGCAVVERYMTCADALFDESVAPERWVGAARPAEARLRAGVTAMVGNIVGMLRDAPTIVELAEMICEVEEGRVILNRHIAKREAQMAAIIAEGVATGEMTVADPARAARGFHMGLKFFFAPFALMRHGLDRVDDDLEAALDLLCAGLRASEQRG